MMLILVTETSHHKPQKMPIRPILRSNKQHSDFCLRVAKVCKWEWKIGLVPYAFSKPCDRTITMDELRALSETHPRQEVVSQNFARHFALAGAWRICIL